jgi:twitching motility protein PilT
VINTAAVDWLHSVLASAAKWHASDIHVHVGAPIKARRFTQLGVLTEQPVAADYSEQILRSVLTDAQNARLDAEGEVDLAYLVDGVGRYRVNVYRQHRGIDGVFHYIPPKPPSLSELGLPTTLAKVTNFHQGLVLITGPAGCGKSSTLAALVDLINRTRPLHVLTIEDPIEFVHRDQRAVVTQREIGFDTPTYASGLRAALRQDPDVILIGEMRDPETIETALVAAETGHLVFSTLHTLDATETINRIVAAFPPHQQEQIRIQLARVFRAAVSQRLLPRADAGGRALAAGPVPNASTATTRKRRTTTGLRRSGRA